MLSELLAYSSSLLKVLSVSWTGHPAHLVIYPYAGSIWSNNPHWLNEPPHNGPHCLFHFVFPVTQPSESKDCRNLTTITPSRTIYSLASHFHILFINNSTPDESSHCSLYTTPPMLVLASAKRTHGTTGGG